jgi:hypothetical protein
MIITPLKMPAEPSPAIARPTMKALELGAAPQTVDCEMLVRESSRFSGE